MSKRSADEPRQGESKRKRHAEENTLPSISEIDDLIENLQKLKQQHHQNRTSLHDGAASQTRQELASLSKKLLPSLQSLASLHHDDETTESVTHDALVRPKNVDQAPANQHTGMKLLIPKMMPPWVSSEIPKEQPPLPRILDPKMESTVFTHPGVSTDDNYERLEWLGDAYLELIASVFISQTFGGNTSGRNSQLREQLVRNVTLASYFRAYNLTTRAKLPRDLAQGFANGKSLGRGRSSDKDLLKTQSDMFEAYVAAAIISDPENGLINTVEWLRTLWGQTIRDQIALAEKKSNTVITSATGRTVLPKESLANAISAKGILIQYKDMPSNKKDPNLKLPLFTVGVYLTGWGARDKLLGTGTALNKGEAGQKAAGMALENKKMIQMYSAKKKAFLEAREASREEQEANH